MATKKTIAVLGASGMQGGSVITHILAQPVLYSHFHIRALSRNPGSLASKPWSDLVPYHQYADADDYATLEKAFAGVHTVFAMTNYWEHQSLERDIQQGRNIANAALSAGVTHLIWSAQYSAAQVKGVPDDMLRLDALDGKAAILDYVEYIKSKRAPAMRATYPITGFYMQNLPRFMIWPLQAGSLDSDASGATEEKQQIYAWCFPWDHEHTQVPLLEATNMGLFVAGILLRELEAPGSLDGSRVHCVSQWSTPKDMVEGFGRARNCTDVLAHETKARQEMLYVDVETEEAYKKCLPEHLREGLAPCMILFRDHPLFGTDGRLQQMQHNRILEGVEGSLTTWEEYSKKGWDRDWHG
jgi:hypothetical protein